jgi:hypothetical protein
MDKIPTNYGMMGIQSIFDHLTYVSYRTQREAGAPVELLKKWYPNAAEFEKQYIKANLPKFN